MLAAMVTLTVPLPVPFALPLVLIQLTSLVAVHAHPIDVFTANDPLPPAAAMDWDAGESVYAHDAPACVTVNVCPPTVIVPLR